MAEGGDGESRRSRRDHDDEPVEKELHGTCGTEQPEDDVFPPENQSMETVTQRLMDLESGSWIQLQESAVPSTTGEPHHPTVLSPSFVQVNDSEGVHVGTSVHYHYHQQGSDERGQSVTAETQGGILLRD